jgi:hypothetical protein
MTVIGLAVAFAATVYLLARQHARSLEHLTALHDQRIDRLVAFQQEDRDRWAAERNDLHAGFTGERLAWERERGNLLNRIKPETKQWVPQRIEETPTMLQPVPYDDDDAFQAEQESREQLANRLAREELNGRTA